MIKQLAMFTVRCDRCGLDSNHGSEYSCWESADSAREQAECVDWKVIDDNDYCPDCIVLVGSAPSCTFDELVEELEDVVTSL